MRALLLILLCLLPRLSRGQVEPPFDPTRERVLVGPGEPPTASSTAGPVLAEAGSLKVGADAYFFARVGDFKDGLVRARFDRFDGLSATLLIRGRVVEGRAEGVGVRLSGGLISVVSIAGGEVKTLGHAGHFKRIFAKGAVEVVVTAFGGVVVAELMRAQDGLPLAQAGATDAPKDAGAIGVVGLGKPKGALLHLSARNACQLAAQEAPIPRQGPPFIAEYPLGVRPDGIPGVKWLETLEKPSREIIFVDQNGLENLYCAEQPPPNELRFELPFKYQDGAMVRLKAQYPRPTRTGFRIDESYKDGAMVEALLRGYADRFPDRVKLLELGKSRQGRPILGVAIGAELLPDDDRPTFFLNGAHHGCEILTVEVVIDAIQQLVENYGDKRIRRILESVVVVAVPIVNPDGLANYVEQSSRRGRKNNWDADGNGSIGPSEGVDLNRNYPFRWGALKGRGSTAGAHTTYNRGKSPGSEPEVQAIMALANAQKFVGSVSYHTGTVAILAPYTIPGVTDPEPNEALLIPQSLSPKIATHPDGRKPAIIRRLYPVDGTDQDWHRHEHGTLALLAEIARDNPIDPQDRLAMVAAARSIWLALIDRFLDGPSLSLQVFDKDGLPVVAEVRLANQKTKAGERWQTRCRDGRLDRYLVRGGDVRLRFIVDGHPPVDRTVTVHGHGDLGVRLPFSVKPTRCPGEQADRAQ